MRNRPAGKLGGGNPDRLERIKTLVVMSMFADDELMNTFVLKGGNALDLIHRVSSRASVDVDLSMERDFNPGELQLVADRIEKSLIETFRLEGLSVFDFTFERRPESVSPDLAEFWGGYRAEFKLIESDKEARFRTYPEALRRNAMVLGERGKFQVDISKFEYCSGKQAQELDGYRVFVYSPLMLACEKLRAICQQMPEYAKIVKRGRPGTARARDFVDIFRLVEAFRLDLSTPESESVLCGMFEAKRVPLSLLTQIYEQREFHRPDFDSVKATVKPGIRLEGFDFYFDFVIRWLKNLKSTGNM